MVIARKILAVGVSVVVVTCKCSSNCTTTVAIITASLDVPGQYKSQLQHRILAQQRWGAF